jgi:hypothetical protein
MSRKPIEVGARVRLTDIGVARWKGEFWMIDTSFEGIVLRKHVVDDVYRVKFDSPAFQNDDAVDKSGAWWMYPDEIEEVIDN